MFEVYKIWGPSPKYRTIWITSNLSLAGDWTAARPAVDLETTPLEIKTDSKLGSGDKVSVIFFNSQRERAGGVEIRFSSTPQYLLPGCTGGDFQSTLPTAIDKAWRISLTKTADIRLQIHCNDLEVVNILLSDETCHESDWRINWSRDVERISFDGDTATEYYKLFTPGRHYVCFELIYGVRFVRRRV